MTLGMLSPNRGTSSVGPGVDGTSIWQIVLAGSVTGLVISPLTTSSELVKIRLQVQRGPGWFDPQEHFPGE